MDKDTKTVLKACLRVNKNSTVTPKQAKIYARAIRKVVQIPKGTLSLKPRKKKGAR